LIFEAKPIEAVLDEEPLLSEPLFTLAEWIAQYYLAPLGEVLRGMLPLTAEVRRTVYYRITDLGRDVLADRLDDAAASSHLKTWGTRLEAAEQSISRRAGHGASCSGAIGGWRTSEGFHAAHRDCGFTACTGPGWCERNGLRARLQRWNAMRGGLNASRF